MDEDSACSYRRCRNLSIWHLVPSFEVFHLLRANEVDGGPAFSNALVVPRVVLGPRFRENRRTNLGERRIVQLRKILG